MEIEFFLLLLFTAALVARHPVWGVDVALMMMMMMNKRVDHHHHQEEEEVCGCAATASGAVVGPMCCHFRSTGNGTHVRAVAASALFPVIKIS